MGDREPPPRTGRQSAQDLFTDRVDEATAFAASLRAVRLVAAGQELPLTGQRHNVLTFYGMGGIGKSTLAARLKWRFEKGDWSPPDSDNRGLLIDFSKGLNDQPEEPLLQLRARLGGIGSWQAFDVGFAECWERRHPGVPLSAIPDHLSGLRRVGDAAGVGQQLQSTVDSVLGSVTLGLAPLVRQVGTSAVREVVGRVRERRLLAACPRFEEIVGWPDPDGQLTELPSLLAWDLHQIQRARASYGGTADVVVFVDTWEDVQQGNPRRGGREDRVSSMAYLMPNVLFVVLGRESIDWLRPERRETLTYGGPDRWAALAQGALDEPRQHRLGFLGPGDREEFLTRCIVRDGQPGIPAPIRGEISRASEGLPYFLDLAADYFIGLEEQGIEPTAEHFRGSFPALVSRMMRDLPEPERELLCAAAVVGTFDEDMLRALVPSASAIAMNRFLARHLVQGPEPGWLSYRIHDVLAQSVQQFDDPAAGSWSKASWNRARRTATEWLVNTALEPTDGAPGSIGDMGRALLLASRLVATTGYVPDRLAVLLWRVELAGGVKALLDTEGVLGRSEWPAAAMLLTAIRGAARDGEFAALCDDLAKARTQATTPAMRDLLALEEASIAFARGALGRAEAVNRQVTAQIPELASAARVQRGGLLMRRAQLKDAMEVFCEEDGLNFRNNRASILFISGRFDAADAALAACAEEGRAAGAAIWAARAARHRVLARTWGGMPVDPELISEALDLNVRVDLELGTAQLEACQAIALARTGAAPNARALIQVALQRCDAAGAPAERLPIMACQAVCEVLLGARDLALEVHRDQVAQWRALDTGALWPVVTGIMLDEDTSDLPEPRWLDGTDRSVWRRVLGDHPA